MLATRLYEDVTQMAMCDVQSVAESYNLWQYTARMLDSAGADVQVQCSTSLPAQAKSLT